MTRRRPDAQFTSLKKRYRRDQALEAPSGWRRKMKRVHIERTRHSYNRSARRYWMSRIL